MCDHNDFSSSKSMALRSRDVNVWRSFQVLLCCPCVELNPEDITTTTIISASRGVNIENVLFTVSNILGHPK